MPPRDAAARSAGGASTSAPAPSADSLSALLKIYQQEGYVLVPGAPDPTFLLVTGLFNREPLMIGVKEDATSRDMLQAVLQAAWVNEHLKASEVEDADLDALLTDSLRITKDLLPNFLSALTAQGWKLDSVLMRSTQSNVIRV